MEPKRSLVSSGRCRPRKKKANSVGEWGKSLNLCWVVGTKATAITDASSPPGRRGVGWGALRITRCLADNYAFDLPPCTGVADAHTDGHSTATLRSFDFPPLWFPARWVTAAWDGWMVGWVGFSEGQRRYWALQQPRRVISAGSANTCSE